MRATFLQVAIDHALAQHPELVKADLMKLLRRVAELEAENEIYRRRYGPARALIFPDRDAA